MHEHKRYIERSDLRDATHLEVSVYYTKGGVNFFSGGSTPRGYYLSVKPVTKGQRTISYVLFSGSARLLMETKRFSAKQLAQAVEIAKSYEESLISEVVKDNSAA